MASNVDICNLALTKLGAARITSLLDETKQAKALNAIFDMERDALLSEHPWTFAIKRAEIPASSTAPAFGWLRAYPLPADYLKLVQVGDVWTFYDAGDLGGLFDVEAGAVLSDEVSPLQIRYVYRVTNAGLFSSTFGIALAARLRSSVAEELTQNLSKKNDADEDYRAAIHQAKRANDIERPPQRVPDLSWVRALIED
jgi:hypothetical protein